MAKNDQQEAYEKALNANLNRVIDLLKFAEAKNAALLAFTSAWIVAIGNILIKDGATLTVFLGVIPVSGALFLLAALIALFSFLPQIDLGRLLRKRRHRDDNLLFYGDISGMEASEFPIKARTRYMPAEGESATDDYLTDLCQQIFANSRIANWKYKLFKIAAWIAMGSMAILVSPAMLFLVRCLLRFLLGEPE